VIELIGTSKGVLEKAAMAAVTRAGKIAPGSARAEVDKLDLQLDAKGKVEDLPRQTQVSFKFEG